MVFRSIVTVLVISLLPNDSIAGVRGFYVDSNFKYTHCDAKIIHSAWKESSSFNEIKAIIRKELEMGEDAKVESWLKYSLVSLTSFTFLNALSQS